MPSIVRLAVMFLPVSNLQRVVKYADKIDRLDMTGMSNPVKGPDIPKCEHHNQIYSSVFSYENVEVILARITAERFNNHIIFLMNSDGKGNITAVSKT